MSNDKSQKTNEDELEKNLGVKFKNPALLHTALVHRSYLNESKEPQSNERLEFLGDAVLEFIVSSAITKDYPNLAEGELTALRSKLVNTTSLASVARKLRLGNALYLSRGEIEGGGRENPDLLADVFEAVIGALFLDQGIPICERIVGKLLLPQAKEALSNLKDPKSLLQEIVQAQGKRAPVYKVLKEGGPDHAKTFTVGVIIGRSALAKGLGKSKKEAEEEAAKEALKKV